jgi:hypothetical protein
MEDTKWLKQTLNQPLFPNLLWSRPENKRHAGKLLIAGGNRHGLASPVAAYNAAVAAGAGTVRVILPNSLKKIISPQFSNSQTDSLQIEFAADNQIGSFSLAALDPFLENAHWADGVILAGDFGKNSETAILLESFIKKHDQIVIFAGDTLDYFLSDELMISKKHSIIVIDLSKLQKLAKNIRPDTPILFSMNLLELVTVLSEWTSSWPSSFITMHADNFIVASGGEVSTTPAKSKDSWQIELAAYAGVWYVQNTAKPFQALSCAVYSYLDALNQAGKYDKINHNF